MSKITAVPVHGSATIKPGLANPHRQKRRDQLVGVQSSFAASLTHDYANPFLAIRRSFG